MSRAFVKETEGEWLGDVAPDIQSLQRFLTRENYGEKVEVLSSSFSDKLGREIHELSNGRCYALDEDGRWMVVLKD
jgi:hypothetical protein